MRAIAPPSPASLALGPARAAKDLGVTLGYLLHELPPLVQDLRQLVNELTAAAAPGGELRRLLGATAELAAARAARERAEAG